MASDVAGQDAERDNQAGMKPGIINVVTPEGAADQLTVMHDELLDRHFPVQKKASARVGAPASPCQQGGTASLGGNVRRAACYG